MHSGEIWIIENDKEDQEAIEIVWKKLDYTNKLVFFRDAESFIIALEKSGAAPFVILCDVRLDGIDGFALRRDMLARHSKKFSSVPFIYWSASFSEQQVTQAFDLSAHGFFIKDDNPGDIKNTLVMILTYWQKSKMPAKRDAP